MRRLAWLVLAAVVVGCGGGSVDRPVHTADAKEGGIMELSSPAFLHADAIPRRFTCDGDDISPPLEVTGVPEAAAALVLVMDDPDAPGGTWDHWIVYDIPTTTTTIPEGVGDLGVDGENSWGRTGYGGPCPPSGTHRYFFTVYAVDQPTALPPGATKEAVLDAIDSHVLAEATLMGRYQRS